ncbi:uncharacterized protein P884DRAFT_253591 [Thermothelomyces heterothallicus CBS 202.75]|uniref:uncharacterized protein n=1 Tax=Thermothelomyces heterothallicus CBS 202.75 TaxID=1149848 RepID=UPI0037428F57
MDGTLEGCWQSETPRPRRRGRRRESSKGQTRPEKGKRNSHERHVNGWKQDDRWECPSLGRHWSGYTNIHWEPCYFLVFFSFFSWSTGLNCIVHAYLTRPYHCISIPTILLFPSILVFSIFQK